MEATIRWFGIGCSCRAQFHCRLFRDVDHCSSAQCGKITRRKVSMEPGTERPVSQKTARRVSFEVQKSSRPCENSARRSRTRKSGRAFAASDRSEPEKSSKTEF